MLATIQYSLWTSLTFSGDTDLIRARPVKSREKQINV